MAEVLTARFDLPADFRAAGRARRIVTEILNSWGRPDDAELARLLVSEVVTNAVRHADQGRPLELYVTADHLRVRVAVGDASTRRPVLRSARDDDESGRGMHLIATLASEWGVDTRPEGDHPGAGKQVWFELPSPLGRPDGPRPGVPVGAEAGPEAPDGASLGTPGEAGSTGPRSGEHHGVPADLGPPADVGPPGVPEPAGSGAGAAAGSPAPPMVTAAELSPSDGTTDPSAHL